MTPPTQQALDPVSFELPDLPRESREDREARTLTHADGSISVESRVFSVKQYRDGQRSAVISYAQAIKNEIAILRNFLITIRDTGMTADDAAQHASDALAQAQSPQPLQGAEICYYCDGTGSVRSFDNGWRGVCRCPAGDRFRAAIPATPAKG